MMTILSRRSRPIRVISLGLNHLISKWVTLATTSFLRLAIRRRSHKRLLLPSQIVKWKNIRLEIRSYKQWHLVLGLSKINPETLQFLSLPPLSSCSMMKKFRSKSELDQTQLWNILTRLIYFQMRQGRAWRTWNKRIQSQTKTEIS